MLKKFKIIMTGGGSAGHVTPNLALVPKLKELNYDIEYIGTYNGIERKIIEGEGIKYYPISSGKLRRYFDLKNFSDPFRVVKGLFDAYKIIKNNKPNIVFSKGGFVAVPVVIGAYLNGVPVIAHESDITPGLANKISSPYCTKVCVTFPESMEHVKKNKAVLTGTPIRKELLDGSRIIGKRICKFHEDKPILMVIGGSLGSKIINEVLRKSLDKLLTQFNIIHICGKGNVKEDLFRNKGYKQHEYVKDELPHFMAAADIVISRAGANVIFELLALKKPNLLIPLSAKSSRGDQILNAKSFEKREFSLVLQEEELNSQTFIDNINNLFINKEKYIKKMYKETDVNAVDAIVDVIIKYTK